MAPLPWGERGLLPCSPRSLFLGCPGRWARREEDVRTGYQPGAKGAVSGLELRDKPAKRSS